MLRPTKHSLLARVALGAALCLSIAASFGLHPEPARAAGRSTGSEVAATASVPAGAHACVACISGGSLLLWPDAELVLAAAPCACAAPCAAPLLLSRLAGRDLSGRSPPSLS